MSPNLSLPAIDTRATHLTTFTIKLDGEDLPGMFAVISVDITREVNRIPRLHLVLYDGDPAAQDFEASNSDLLAPGKAIEVHGGYASDEKVLFKGVITTQRIRVRRDGDSLLEIDAHHPAFRMTLDRKSHYFGEMSDSDIFEQIISTYPDLQAQVEATTLTYPEILQYQVSDWDFIVSRAEKIGMQCLAEDGALRIGKPDVNQSPALTLAYGTNVLDLDLELDARTQFSKVSAFAWDPANGEVISSESEDAAAPNAGNLTGSDLAEVSGVETFELRSSGALKPEEIEAWAQAAMLKSRFARIRGTLRFQGSEAVLPGGLVELDGMGERFNGSVYVSGVRHVLGGGDWETTLQIGLRREWHHQVFTVSAAPGSGFHPAINGLQIGLVNQLQEDPDGEFRIRVLLPLISAAEQDGIWSRVATLDAGDGRGTFFLPEIGDEVIVGFINDDPTEPVVLGGLHSSKRPAPLEAQDDNHQKGLVTRSGMQLLFDDEAPSLLIDTPAGNKITLDEKDKKIEISDQNGNKITLDKDGISMESAKDFKIKASGNITIEGNKLEVKASSSLKVESNASATLQSSGSLTIKGSVVQIN